MDCDIADPMDPRINAIMEAIYAAFTTVFMVAEIADIESKAVVDEAIQLARILATNLPQNPEAKGLLALMLLVESRRAARHTTRGEFVPLDQQDMTLWNQSWIQEGNRLLVDAHHAKQIGRYQLEAAIQSVHCDRLRTGETKWVEIHELYQVLVMIHPSPGARVAKAFAKGNGFNPQAGLDELLQIPLNSVETYQPYWVTYAELLSRLGRSEQAIAAKKRALQLTTDLSVLSYLS